MSGCAETPKHITSPVKESYSKQFLDHSKQQYEYTHPALSCSSASNKICLHFTDSRSLTNKNQTHDTMKLSYFKLILKVQAKSIT